MLYIKDIKRYLNCPRLFYYDKFIERVVGFSYFRINLEIANLGIDKLNIDHYYLGKQNDSSLSAISNINNYKWFVKARFEYQGLRVKIPFIKREADGLIVYFVDMSTSVKISELNYYAYHIWVLKKLNLHIKDIKVLYFNKDYIRDGRIDGSEILKISSKFDSVRYNNIYDLINRKNIDLSAIIKVINSITIDSDIKRKYKFYSKNCHICPIYSYCFKPINYDSIFTMRSLKDKVKLYNKGITTINQLHNISFNSVLSAQYLANINNGYYIDKTKIRNFFKSFNRPLVFIDFEWEQYLLPPYDHMKVNDIITFQYSLHILYSYDQIVHKEYLGKKDCRYDIIDHLINDIPDNGTFIAFNAYGAERLRLLEFIKLAPKYQDKLQYIIDNLYDISKVFNNGWFYHQAMLGSYSLKSISSALDLFKYKDVDSALLALDIYRNIEYGNNNHQQIDKLKQYCFNDSYALLLLYQYLSNLIK